MALFTLVSDLVNLCVGFANLTGILSEHCLNSIHQTVQCYGSTTLIPTRFREGLGFNYIDSDQVHVCRSFRFLPDFTTSRDGECEY